MRRLVVVGFFLVLTLGACDETSSTTTVVDNPPDETSSATTVVDNPPDETSSTTTVVGNPSDEQSSGTDPTPQTSIVGAEAAKGVRETFSDLGREHLSDDDTSAVIAGSLAPPEYNSVPPTSGTHAPFWAQCGVYLQAIPDIVQVHSLEHGAVLIQYNPDIDPADISALEEFAREKGSHVVVAPNPTEVPYIVLTAWTVRMELSTLDMVAIEGFWLDFANEGPERVPCPFQVDEAAGQSA